MLLRVGSGVGGKGEERPRSLDARGRSLPLHILEDLGKIKTSRIQACEQSRIYVLENHWYTSEPPNQGYKFQRVMDIRPKESRLYVPEYRWYTSYRIRIYVIENKGFKSQRVNDLSPRESRIYVLENQGYTS